MKNQRALRTTRLRREGYADTKRYKILGHPITLCLHGPLCDNRAACRAQLVGEACLKVPRAARLSGYSKRRGDGTVWRGSRSTDLVGFFCGVVGVGCCGSLSSGRQEYKKDSRNDRYYEYPYPQSSPLVHIYSIGLISKKGRRDIGQNMADNKGVFVCGSVTIPTSPSATGTIAAAGGADLRSCLVPTYLFELPVDPVSSTAWDGTTYNTGYGVIQDSNGRVHVVATTTEPVIPRITALEVVR